MNTERDKFLTEYFGECWHEWKERASGLFIEEDCAKCNEHKDFKTVHEHNFSTPDGFFWLWNKCQEQEWWSAFKKSQAIGGSYTFDEDLVHPDRFADTLYQFLKEK
jgi:hypothetical protein